MSTHTPIHRIRDPWPGSLTARERFLRQMNYQSVDRCFHWEFGYWDENFSQWAMFRDNGITSNAAAEPFIGLDEIRILNGNVWIHPGFPRKRSPKPKPIVSSVIVMACSPRCRWMGTIPSPASYHPPSKRLDDWAKVKEERFRRDDPERTVDIEALKRLHPADRDYVLMIDGGSLIGRVRDLLTLEGLAYACY